MGLAEAVFAVSPDVRYVAVGRGQRGEIDRGGLDYLVAPIRAALKASL